MIHRSARKLTSGRLTRQSGMRAFALVVGALTVVGQTPDTAFQRSPSFDVVSIKTHIATGPEGVRVTPGPGGRLTITNVSLRLLIMFAYGIQDSQLFDVPEWADTATFDITAKADRDVPGGDLFAMLRPVLRDRFKLAVRQSSREIPVYALAVARTDGAVGANLKSSEVNCSGAVKVGAQACQFNTGFGSIRARGMPLSALARAMSQFAGRVVVDRTGRVGPQDFDLTWTPDRVRAADGPPIVENGRTIDPNGPSLFTAVQEQLGLKLDTRKEFVDVLIFEHAEKPTED